ncbi:MAG TPA: NAD(P)H-dependent glycerol-3-phosphate dehydrogenase [Planctomycetota bacterium]|nr:NAD(P)H-dependent glycerol-3-phosphate dehydrogenase [Planctomycetota bacterium]
MENVAVLGDGAWGTALALVLAERGASVIQWSVSAERALEMQTSRANRKYLPGYRMPDGVTVTAEASAFGHADLIFSAVPSQYLHAVLASLAPHVDRGRPFVSATKGLEFPSHRRATEIILQTLGPRPIAVLSGPSLAGEVVAHMPTAVVAASRDLGLALRVQDLLTTERFRVYTSNDPVGVELGGALKNVLAIAGGLVDGLGLGDNTKAALLTRGQAEMARLGTVLGGHPDTFHGLSGIGDLVVSCMSRQGRNRLVGERIGRGESLEKILRSIPGVPEGVRTSKAVMQLAAERGVEMPICHEIHEVLYAGKDPLQAVADLMTRQQKDEVIT